MNDELKDFESWSADWQSVSEEAPVSIQGIRRRVRRYTWYAALGWAINLVLLTVVTIFAWHDGRPPIIAGAIAVWGFVAVATVFDLRYRRGTWQASGDTTEDFVDLARRQVVAKLKGLRFGWYLLAGEALFFLFWIPWVVSGKPDSTPAKYLLAFGYMTAMLVAFGIGLSWLIRRTKCRLARLDHVRRGLERLDRAA